MSGKLRCFFDDVRGQGECMGKVKVAGGVEDAGWLPLAKRGYCEAHRFGNLERARWEGVKGAPKARLSED